MMIIKLRPPGGPGRWAFRSEDSVTVLAAAADSRSPGQRRSPGRCRPGFTQPPRADPARIQSRPRAGHRDGGRAGGGHGGPPGPARVAAETGKSGSGFKLPRRRQG